MYPASPPMCVGSRKTSSKPRLLSTSRSTPPRHPRAHQSQSERDHENPRFTPRTARRRADERAAFELHLSQDPGQADRHQPQRDHPPGGRGAAAARRRAADQREPAGLPAEEATMMRRLLAAILIALAPAAIAQTPSVDSARAAGAVGERYDGYVGIAGSVSAAVR